MQLRHNKKKAANAKTSLTLPDTPTTIDSKAMAASAGRTDTPYRKHPSLEFFPSFLPSPCAVATTTTIAKLTCGSYSRHSFSSFPLQCFFFFFKKNFRRIFATSREEKTEGGCERCIGIFFGGKSGTTSPHYEGKKS